MKIPLQQIEPSVLLAQGLQAIPGDLLSADAQSEHYCLLYTVGGSFEVQWEQKSFLIPENCAFLFFPNQTYSIQSVSKDLQLIDVRFDLSERSSASQTLQKATRRLDEEFLHAEHTYFDSLLVLKPTPQIKRTLEAILWEWQKKLTFSQEIVDLYLKTILLGLIRTTMEPQAAESSDTAEKIMRYVHEHITESLQNEDAARALSYHPNYINRVIKKVTGMTFHKYVIDEKLNYATTLLLSTNNSITEIAYSLSFNTSSHFSNLFAEKYQCTPSQYRKRKH